MNLINQRCEVCGHKMAVFGVYDRATGEAVDTEVSCPEEWRESHN